MPTLRDLATPTAEECRALQRQIERKLQHRLPGSAAEVRPDGGVVLRLRKSLELRDGWPRVVEVIDWLTRQGFQTWEIVGY